MSPPEKIESWEELEEACEFLGITFEDCIAAAIPVSDEDE